MEQLRQLQTVSILTRKKTNARYAVNFANPVKMKLKDARNAGIVRMINSKLEALSTNYMIHV